VSIRGEYRAGAWILTQDLSYWVMGSPQRDSLLRAVRSSGIELILGGFMLRPISQVPRMTRGEQGPSSRAVHWAQPYFLQCSRHLRREQFEVGSHSICSQIRSEADELADRSVFGNSDHPSSPQHRLDGSVKKH